MKKTCSALLILVMLIITAGSSFAKIVPGSDKIADGYLTNVVYSSAGGSETVTINLKDYVDFNVMKISNPDRIVIDISNAIAPGKQQIIDTNGKVVKRIRYAQFDTYTARVVIEVDGEPEYGIKETGSGLVVYIGGVPEEPDNSDTQTDGTAAAGENAVSGTISIDKNFNIAYTPKDGSDEVAVLLADYDGYNVMRLTDPDRIVIDIPDAKYAGKPKQADTNGSMVKSIRYAQHGNTARIVLDLTCQAQYKVTESRGRLLFSVTKPEYKNITYSNSGDRVYFLLRGSTLTEGDEFLKKLYTESTAKGGRKYTITFPSRQADLGSGTFKINDEYIKDLTISNDLKSGTTSMTFNGKDAFSYLVFTRGGTGDTTITILKPAAKGEKLVVIDPGHGGSAPGAIFGDLTEKDLNLDISARLNSLLEKRNIKTYMTRDSDDDVWNYERAYIANKLKASLFISIHNNAMDDQNYGGTMTLYFPSNSRGFCGKSFADIVQRKLAGSLGTIDRKTMGRPNLVVLKATAMPAAIAEIAFLTNSSDRNKLSQESFRQKAAQALCDAIVTALKKA